MNKFLVFHYHETIGNQAHMAPAYYMDADYELVAARIYAANAPLRDAKFDILKDGVSIFSNRTTRAWNKVTGVEITGVDATDIQLTAGQNSEELLMDFNTSIIEESSWVSAMVVDAGGGKNFSVQLELKPMSEGEDD